jgi:error-prone DNA polymerase
MPDPPFDKIHAHPFRLPAQASTPRRIPSDRAGISYAELAVTTNFTFLTGASHPEEMVRSAAALGHQAAAIADTNSLAGIVRAHVAAKEAGIPLAIGCRVVLRHPAGLQILAYAASREGYTNLCRLLTRGRRRAPKGECDLDLHDLMEHATGLLAVVLPPTRLDDDFISVLSGLTDVFRDDRLSLGVQREYGPDDAGRISQLRMLSEHVGVPLAAWNDVHHNMPERRLLQDVVTCIRHGCSIEQAGLRLHGNAERHMKPPREMARLFRAVPRALQRSVAIAERASAFSLDELRYEYPVEPCPPGVQPIRYLAELTRIGAEQRYPAGVPDAVWSTVQHELALIEELNYPAYFLTCHDIVRFARSQGILCQGRGAAANSAVCYCLGVTEVNPDRADLLFERFVSRERDEPPDIDIDFEHERREEVIQYIYRKYGRDRAALTAVVTTYRGRSAVREVGKAMGLSLDCVDALAKNLDRWYGDACAKRVREVGLDPEDPTIARVIQLTNEITGFPRHLSQHVGGFVITRSPLHDLVPIENAAMEDRTVIEWDKDDIDAMNMLKVDVLGLGMLTCVRKGLELVVESATKRRSDGATKGGCDGNCSDFSRSHCVAAGDGACDEDVRGNTVHASGGAVRAHDADASCGCLGAIEHCGGPWQAVKSRLRPISENSAGLTGRACNTDRAGRITQDARSRCTNHQRTSGNRQSASRAHSFAREQIDVDQPTPSSLRRSVAPSLYSLFSALAHTNDPSVYDMICRADTIGVFQIESRAQMSMLPRLRPRTFYDLVIEVAIVRPGPIQGRMVHPYLRRRNGEEPVEYPHPDVERVLGRTLGVPLFQEQAMQLAITAAGFTPGEADQLRRAMAAWRRKGDKMAMFGEKLISGMLERGYPRDFAERCFEQIKGFSEYGFPESHAASFAILVYVSSWLKCHEPAAFAAALINSQPMGFYRPAQIIRDAREHGVDVRPIDVNHSTWDCTLEGSAKSLRLGMRLVKGLGQEDADRVADAVRQQGPFGTIDALWRASGVSIKSLRALARADAFGSMQLDRQGALWQIRPLRDEAMPLFDHIRQDASAREDLERSGISRLPEIAPARHVLHDYQSTTLSLKAHPVSFVRQELQRRGCIQAGELRDEKQSPQGRRVRVAGLVLVRQRPSTASGIVFITLEDESGIANLIIRPKVFERYRQAARLSVVLLAEGRVERQGEVVHVQVSRMECLDELIETLPSASRDFH